MKNIFLPLVIVFSFGTSFFIAPKATEAYGKNSGRKDTLSTVLSFSEPEAKPSERFAAEQVYASLKFPENILEKNVFETAFKGFENLKKAGKVSPDSHLLTVCDFSKSSNTKRLWVIDTDKKEVLFNTLVAHGKNTGEEFAEHFSNTESSYQSSLGFYITDVTYSGDNGYSLKLLGMDKGFNDNALQRAIVMHGAAYVSDDFAREHKRIGRSWGCPAVPKELAEPVINTIKDQNVLFIYYPDENYLHSSEWLKN